MEILTNLAKKNFRLKIRYFDRPGIFLFFFSISRDLRSGTKSERVVFLDIVPLLKVNFEYKKIKI